MRLYRKSHLIYKENQVTLLHYNQSEFIQQHRPLYTVLNHKHFTCSREEKTKTAARILVKINGCVSKPSEQTSYTDT